MKKREFIKDCSVMAGAIISGRAAAAVEPVKTLSSMRRKSSTMKLRFVPYELHLKHVFTLATSSRTTTPVVLTEIEYDGQKGYGEASMPPYLGESHETVIKFLSQVNLSH